MGISEQMPPEGAREEKKLGADRIPEIKVVIGGVVEVFESRQKYREFLQDQLNEQK